METNYPFHLWTFSCEDLMLVAAAAILCPWGESQEIWKKLTWNPINQFWYCVRKLILYWLSHFELRILLLTVKSILAESMEKPETSSLLFILFLFSVLDREQDLSNRNTPLILAFLVSWKVLELSEEKSLPYTRPLHGSWKWPKTSWYVLRNRNYDQPLSSNLSISEHSAILKNQVHVPYNKILSWERILSHKHQLYLNLILLGYRNHDRDYRILEF